MSEKTLRKYITKGLKPFGHLSQIESHATSVGFPDTNFCFDGIEGNIELKYWSPKKGYVLRKNQIAWIRDRIKAKGRVFLLFLREQDGKHYFLIEMDAMSLAAVSKTSKAAEWEAQSCVQWDGRIDFEELEEFLIDE
ncbi:hypothetical protein JKY79_03010 [Candidatus Babeliales bacterium]|nr:hypothetical protein [Candidatus Babeliales bacterium]